MSNKLIKWGNVAWGNVIRRIFRVPYRTHNDIVIRLRRNIVQGLIAEWPSFYLI